MACAAGTWHREGLAPRGLGAARADRTGAGQPCTGAKCYYIELLSTTLGGRKNGTRNIAQRCTKALHQKLAAGDPGRGRRGAGRSRLQQLQQFEHWYRYQLECAGDQRLFGGCG